MQTQQLLLRPFHPNDVDDVLAAASHPQWGTYLSPGIQPYSRSDAEWFVSVAILSNFEINPHFAMVFNHHVIGGIVLNQEVLHEVAELFYFMGPAHWGTSFATQATQAIVEWGFNTWGVWKIFSQVDSRNEARIRIMKKLGMKQDGLHRAHRIHLDERVDVAIFSVLRSEWSLITLEGKPANLVLR